MTKADDAVPTTTRALPYVLVATLAILVLGGIAWSLSSAPPLDQAQLRLAARATMGASSFALIDTNSVSPGGPGSTSEVFHVVYRAPDDVEESEVGPNGQIDTVILLGSRRFRGSGSQFTELPASPGLAGQAVQTIMSPLKAASTAGDVTRHGDLYRFVPLRRGPFLATVLGVPQSQVSSPVLTAVVDGEYVTHERITAVVGRQRLEVDLAFFDIGSAPPVTAPPSSSLVPAAPPGAATP